MRPTVGKANKAQIVKNVKGMVKKVKGKICKQIQMENNTEQLNISKVPPQLQAHVYKKGQSGNPGGRPKNTLKEYAKQKIAQMTEEEREEFLNGIDKRVIWEMAEGKAKQDVDVSGELTSKIISVDE